MKFNYKFQNLLGTVYRKGDVLFSKDGNCVISPVGNKITIYNLKQNESTTLSVESKYNYTALDVSPNGSVLLAINEKGEAHMISLVTYTVVHRYKFKTQVNAVKFSPDGKYFAACCDSTVFIMTAPLAFTGEFRSFVMKRVFKKAYDEVTCLDWSSCSKLVAVGSKDTTTKIYTVDYLDNINMYSMSGHTDKIVGVFFEKKSLDLITVSRNGQVCLWEASIDPDDLVTSRIQISHSKRRKMLKDEYSEDDLSDKEAIEKDKENVSDEDEGEIKPETNNETEKKLVYKKLGRHYIGDSIRNAHHRCNISAAQYHKETKILVTGFTTGIFFLHEMPDVNLIHTLSISEHRISSIAVSPQGDWIAFGCPNIGQLLVWEWQSEQYVMKQQGHSLDMTCLAYSPDGLYIATGGYDGKVKLWDTSSGFCVVTFHEHKSTVTGIAFSANKKFFVSSSLDGTVRCCDLTRYRNFRTLTCTSAVQLSCVALDGGGELCAAGGQDVFHVFVWAVQLGRLLEVVSGHEAGVGSVAWGGGRLASAGWDRTVRLWDVAGGGAAAAGGGVLQLHSDALHVAFSPDAAQLAVSTLDGNISLFSAESLQQQASIEGRHDLGSGRADADLVTAQTMLKTKAFTSICYSADGELVLGAGNSKHVCLYSARHAVLVKKFVVTQNRSLDAVDDFVNRRVLSEWGNMSLVERRGELEGGAVTLPLPGERHGGGARSVKPEVRVYCVRFSPSGDGFAAASSEGLLLYGGGGGGGGVGGGGGGGGGFRPLRLQAAASRPAALLQLQRGLPGAALAAALQLDDRDLLRRVLARVPPSHVALTVNGVEAELAGRLVAALAALLARWRHVELLLLWLRPLLARPPRPPLPSLLALERALTTHYSRLSKICDFNKYTIRCIKTVGDMKPKLEDAGMEVDSDGSSGRGTYSDTE